MKNLKKISMGLVLLNIFIISTVALLVIILCKLLPQESSRVIVNIWLVELFLVAGYCLLFYDARRAKKPGKRNISVLRH
jgi:hypothetical protein